MFDKLDRLSAPFSAERILALGLTRQKTGYILELATTLTTALFDLKVLTRTNDDEVRLALMTLP